MNAQQVDSALRIALAAGGPVAALILKYTKISQDDYLLWYQIVLMVVPPLVAAVWGWLAHTAPAQVVATRELPGVQTVVVKDSTRGKLGEMAASPDFPDIKSETQAVADAVAKVEPPPAKP